LSKLLVNDMAGEFGISVDEVLNLLRQMDVPVRTHMSHLSDDQVARIRARWEREKRARATAAPAGGASTRRRLRVVETSGTAWGTGAAASAAGAAAPRRRRVDAPPAGAAVARALFSRSHRALMRAT